MLIKSRDLDPLTAGDSQALAAFKLPSRLLILIREKSLDCLVQILQDFSQKKSTKIESEKKKIR
jgi:hypothetical protein